jgi:AcrR family transcriptional regulator
MTASASTRAAANRRGRKGAGRPRGSASSDTRDALLDAAERLMLDEGYAAVTSRRVATSAGTDAALVYYYFGTMDDLFIALFRRSAERSSERFRAALGSPQPLWALWDTMHEQTSTALMTELIALANHRKAVKTVMVANSRKFRKMQLERLESLLEGYGLDPQTWPPAAVIVVLASISRYLRTDEAFGVDVGHDETVELVERSIRALEGERGAVTVATQTRTRHTPIACSAVSSQNDPLS